MKLNYKPIAAYYDAEHEGHEYLQQDVPFFLSHLHRRQRVIELGVGTGRAAIPMALAGHKVTGIDRDPEMLEIARQKCERDGIAAASLELVQADILEFQTADRFDWACLLFNTFLSLTEALSQRRMIRKIHTLLKSGGKIYLDLYAPNLPLLAAGASTGLDARIFYVPELNRTVFCALDVQPGRSGQVQRVSHRYEWFDDKGRRRRARVNFEMTWMFPRELQSLLEENGFQVLRMCGDYDGSAVTDDSPRMIVVAQKR